MLRANRWFAIALLLGFSALCCRSAWGDATGEELQALRKHVENNSAYSADQKPELLRQIDHAVTQNARPGDVVVAILEKLDADFESSMACYRNGELENAMQKWRLLIDSKDSFVAIESTYQLANALVAQEDFESALTLLSQDRSGTSLHKGDAKFLMGLCQSNLLQSAEALESFSEFLRKFPDAPERQRVAAFMHFERLSMLEPGTLLDIYQKMEYSRRRLSKAKANEPTQKQQQEALAILDKLIKEAEEREAISESENKKEGDENKSDSMSESKGAGKEGAGEGVDDKTTKQTVRQVQQGAESSPWDFLRDKKRDAEALSAIKEKYPARYRALIEQYYRSLQDERER